MSLWFLFSPHWKDWSDCKQTFAKNILSNSSSMPLSVWENNHQFLRECWSNFSSVKSWVSDELNWRFHHWNVSFRMALETTHNRESHNCEMDMRLFNFYGSHNQCSCFKFQVIWWWLENHYLWQHCEYNHRCGFSFPNCSKSHRGIVPHHQFWKTHHSKEMGNHKQKV